MESVMSYEKALEVLSVSEGAGFDDTMKAKKRLLAKYQGDAEQEKLVESAYDVLLMASLTRRQKGESVDRSVRWADVFPSGGSRKGGGGGGGGAGGSVSAGVGGAASKAKESLGELATTLTTQLPAVEAPGSGDVSAQEAGAYGFLLIIILLSPGDPSGLDLPPTLQLAIALALSTYSLRKNKFLSLPRSVGLSFLGLALGLVLGSAVQAWLRVDLVPLVGLHSPAKLVSSFGLTGLVAARALLR